MKLKAIAAGIALSFAASSAMAVTCSSNTSIDPMGPPGFSLLGNTFYSATSFADCYNFSLSGPTDSFGGVLEWDLANNRNINLTGVELLLGATSVGTDSSPAFFSFGGLSAGSYTLAVSGVVTSQSAFIPINLGVGYLGSITTLRDQDATVPVPGTLALLGLSLTGLAALRRRVTAR